MQKELKPIRKAMSVVKTSPNLFSISFAESAFFYLRTNLVKLELLSCAVPWSYVAAFLKLLVLLQSLTVCSSTSKHYLESVAHLKAEVAAQEQMDGLKPLGIK